MPATASRKSIRHRRASKPLGSEARYFNRELSWLEFNHRVLAEAFDGTNPLLERVKFFCIFNSNLDEFFEVRVAGLMEARQQGVHERSPDGMDAAESLMAVRHRVLQLADEGYRCWRENLVPELVRHGIEFLEPQQIQGAPATWLADYYREKVAPVLTPMYGAYAALMRAREVRQPLELDLPERKIVLDEQGRVASVAFKERLEAIRLTEQCTVLTKISATVKVKHRKQHHRIRRL